MRWHRRVRVYVACLCTVIAETPRLNTHISRASHVFNHTIWHAAWALRLCVKFSSLPPPPSLSSARSVYCVVVFAPLSLLIPLLRQNVFWDAKQRRQKKENMQCVIKQGERHEMRHKESRYMELNLLQSQSLYFSSTINVHEYILAASMPKHINS